MARARALTPEQRRPFLYSALVVFTGLYYYRPEDFIPGLGYIPMAKIAGLFGIFAMIAGMSGSGRLTVPREVKILWLLFIQMSICVPFALWPGGSFATVFEKFSKGVVVAMLVTMAVVNVNQLRKLLWIQVSAVAIVTFGSIVLRHHDLDGRLAGIQKGILENPNDLAINIAISFPLAFAFMLRARGAKKVVWAFAMATMSLGIVMTYSRSGLLAFLLTIVVCVWEYGVKGRRYHIVAATAMICLFGMAAALSTSHYRVRVESIFLGNIKGSMDKGSLQARKDLLKKSIIVAATHPVFGVGPGCFPLVDRGWRVAHNSYTELAAESGIAALVLFLLAIGGAFRNIAKVHGSDLYEKDMEFQLFTQALWAALAAYVVGSAFASTEYNLYPYFMVAYTCAMLRIAGGPKTDKPRRQLQTWNRIHTWNKAQYDGVSKRQTIWSR
jgi:O-antigen ligase